MKYLFTACALMMLVACSTKDEQYYRRHPEALEVALKDCPAKQPAAVSCEKLVALAVNINQLAFQLQTSPQNFGKQILVLQEKLAQQQADLQANPNQSEFKAAIDKIEQLLAEHLAVVKWLESPES